MRTQSQNTYTQNSAWYMVNTTQVSVGVGVCTHKESPGALSRQGAPPSPLVSHTPSPGWGSWSVLLLHWVRPTMATILAPRLLRRFLAVVVPVPLPACWDPQISPLMLELRTTFLGPGAEAGLGSPLNMVQGEAGPQTTLWGRRRDKGVPHQTPGPLYCSHHFLAM